jgi:hypothetical protein
VSTDRRSALGARSIIIIIVTIIITAIIIALAIDLYLARGHHRRARDI